jgi:hypothetical protein
LKTSVNIIPITDLEYFLSNFPYYNILQKDNKVRTFSVDEIWSLVHRHYKNSLLDIEFLNAQIIQLQRSIEFRNLNLYYDHKTRKELEDLEDAAIRLQSVSITDLNDGWFELSMYSGLENLISYKLKGVCELGY